MNDANYVPAFCPNCRNTGTYFDFVWQQWHTCHCMRGELERRAWLERIEMQIKQSPE